MASVSSGVVLCPPLAGYSGHGDGRAGGGPPAGRSHGTKGATGLARGAMVAGSSESMLLVLLALMATSLCVGAGRGALKSWL